MLNLQTHRKPTVKLPFGKTGSTGPEKMAGKRSWK
jgi:hypothetical protein